MAFDIPNQPFNPILSTRRLDLVLHNSSPEHYTCMIDCCNTASFLKYLGDYNMHTSSDIDKLLAGTMLQRKLFKGHESETGYLRQSCHYHIQPRAGYHGAGKLIGGVSLGQRDDNVPPDNGWALLDGYGGQGYATEAAAELLRYVRDEMGIIEIMAWPNPENIGSVRVAEKIGMVRVGEVRDKDTGKIQVVYVLAGMEWRPADGLEIGMSR